VGYKPVVRDHNLTMPVLINDLALRAHQNSSERAGNLRQASSSYEARCQRRIATSAYRMASIEDCRPYRGSVSLGLLAELCKAKNRQKLNGGYISNPVWLGGRST
jgi:hypothetical protein